MARATPKPKPTDAEVREATPAPDDIPDTDFRHVDYKGPLNIEQAAWRNRNIKPVREAVEK